MLGMSWPRFIDSLTMRTASGGGPAMWSATARASATIAADVFTIAAPFGAREGRGSDRLVPSCKGRGAGTEVNEASRNKLQCMSLVGDRKTAYDRGLGKREAEGLTLIGKTT